MLKEKKLRRERQSPAAPGGLERRLYDRLRQGAIRLMARFLRGNVSAQMERIYTGSDLEELRKRRSEIFASLRS